ncbi:MAG: polyhydroxybutyrate depolymerase [Pseudomonadota bacterium]
MRLARVGAFAAVLLLTACATPQHTSTLTVSGLSSGGYAAGLLHVAFAERIDGVGIIAAGPYDCARGDIARALGPCLRGQDLMVDGMVAHARAGASSGAVATTAAVAGDRVWLMHGTRDTVVARDVVEATGQFYRALGARVTEVLDVDAPHGLPTRAAGGACDRMGAPFLNACGYDAAGELLQTLMGRSAAAGGTASGTLTTVAQPAAAGLAADAYVYRPPQCQRGGCAVHIVLHGCQQGQEFVDLALARDGGFNRWADAFDLVVLYPQVAASAVNPLGCWDWWGYTGSQYATRAAVQLNAILTLAEALAEPAR